MIVGIDPESPLATICQVNDVIAKINEQSIQLGRGGGEADQRAGGARSADPQSRPPRRRRDRALHDPGALMSSGPLVPAVERLAAGESLSAAECQEAVGAILDAGAGGRRPGRS